MILAGKTYIYILRYVHVCNSILMYMYYNIIAHQLTIVTRDLETERGKVTQLKKHMEGLKKKTKTDQEKAARLVCTCVVFMYMYCIRVYAIVNAFILGTQRHSVFF